MLYGGNTSYIVIFLGFDIESSVYQNDSKEPKNIKEKMENNS